MKPEQGEVLHFVKQMVFIAPKDNPLLKNGERVALEFSFLAGNRTVVLPQHLAKTSYEKVKDIYDRMELAYPTWKRISQALGKLKLQALPMDIPNPEPGEGYLEMVPLEKSGSVALLVRRVPMEMGKEVLMGKAAVSLN